jgi:hypothetical protein
MLVVDPWHWLDKDGSLPTDNSRLRRQVLRVARFIEYGAGLRPMETRETLVECTKRPGGKPCPGLMWVVKTSDETIEATCLVCSATEMHIHNWQETDWADGMMEPVPVRLAASGPTAGGGGPRDSN